jgi:hypothetical protein
VKWIKHMTRSTSDPDLGDSFMRFQAWGPYVFWKILEIIGSEFNPHDPGVIDVSVEWLETQLQMKSKKFLPILAFFAERPLKKNRPKRFLIHEYLDGENKMIRITCPGFVDLTDDYTRKVLKQMGEGDGA